MDRRERYHLVQQRIKGNVLVRGLHDRVSGSCNNSRKAISGSILVAEVLDPSLYESVMVAAAVVCSSGGLTGHMQSICRARGIPVLRVDSAEISTVTGTVTLELDTGWVIFDAASSADLKQPEAPELALEDLGSICVVISGLNDIQTVNATDPAGIESFFIREEFLFLEFSLRPLDSLNGTPEDAAGYGTAMGDALCRLVSALTPGQRVVFRLLDLRSDDAVQISERDFIGVEANPEMGMHGARWLVRSAHYPLALAALVQQLKARLGADAGKVSFAMPFVNDAEEFSSLRAHLEADGLPMAAFIETPAAVHSARDICAAGASELFVGTKDLVQFYLAADRGNHLVRQSYQTRHPAVLDALSRLVDSTHAYGSRIRVFGLGPDLAHYVRNIPSPDGYMICTAEFLRLVNDLRIGRPG